MAGDGGAEAVPPDHHLDLVPQLGGQPAQRRPGVRHAALLRGLDEIRLDSLWEKILIPG